MARKNLTFEFTYFQFNRPGVLKQTVAATSIDEAAARLHAIVSVAITIFDYRQVAA